MSHDDRHTLRLERIERRVIRQNKKEAVRRMLTGDMTAAEMARELGISRDLVRTLAKELREEGRRP